MRSIKDYLLLVVKGMAMGAADVIPGVSGGTIAFITNIYEELLESLKSINGAAFAYLKRFQFNYLWSHINGNFLLAVFGGVFISILSFARVFHYLLESYPIQLWSFFFGLILISSIWVLKRIKKWNVIIALAGIAGCLVAYFITSASPASTPEGHLFTFLSGAIAICAMILPGISGSFILLILGKYQPILLAVKNFDILTILVFLAGCVTGLLSFVRLVSWFLKKYHDTTVSVLAGFMVGSLYKVWPWKITVTSRMNSDGELVPLLQDNILPTVYLQKTGEDPHILSALLFFAIGIFLVVFLEKLANYISESKTGM